MTIPGKHVALLKCETREQKGCEMIDFIFTGLIYLALMFAVLACFSFITIGITYAASAFIRRCMHWVPQPDLVVK